MDLPFWAKDIYDLATSEGTLAFFMKKFKYSKLFLGHMGKSKKQERSKQIWISLIIVGILITSVLSFIYGGQNDAEKIEYKINGKTYYFGQVYNKYYLNINNEQIYFYNLPDQININISDDIIQRIKNSNMLYLTFDPNEESLGYMDLARLDLFNEFFNNNVYIVNSMTEESEQYNLPIVDCSNSTQHIPVIKLEIDDENKSLDVKDNCIIFKGNGLDFVKFRDLMIYKLYEVY